MDGDTALVLAFGETFFRDKNPDYLIWVKGKEIEGTFRARKWLIFPFSVAVCPTSSS